MRVLFYSNKKEKRKTMKKLLFIYNPHAGKEQIKSNLLDIIDVFVKARYEVIAYPTQCRGDASAAVRNRHEDVDLIVCSGGDGTLDEVVYGMMQCEKRIPIGYVPAGSTNDFANSLKIPKKMHVAAQIAVAGQAFPCDVGKFNEKNFIYIAAFGLFTDVSYETRQDLKNVLGHMAYVVEGMKRLAAIPAYKLKVEYDDQVLEEEFIFGMITNSVSVGGFKRITGKHVQLDDGVFEVTLIKKPNNPLEVNEIINSFLIERINTEYMYCFKTDRVVITAEEEIPWTLDGEYGGSPTQVEICNEKQAITIMVPPKA